MKRFEKILSGGSIFLICVAAVCGTSKADATIDFLDGDQLDGHVVGSTANYTDTTTGVSATLTTSAMHVGGFVDTHNGFLGLGANDVFSFNGGEFWEFTWSKTVLFKSLSFGQMDSQATDQVLMQCDDWIGETFTPTDAGRVTFDSATGTFTLDRGLAGGVNQTWDLDDLTGGVELSVEALTGVRFSVGSFSDANMTQMVWCIPVELVKVTPEGSKLNDGVIAGGQLSDVFDSDNQYFELDPSPTKNLLKQKVHLILQSTSPTDTPTEFRFRLESSMTGGPSGDVLQTIELLNYDTGVLELVDVRAAAALDEIVEVIPVGDLSRFVQPITNEITTEVTWKSESFAGPPFTWSIDVDEAVWLILD